MEFSVIDVCGLFKPVQGGYIFRAPNPWVFGRGRYFLVNEAQKKLLGGIMAGRRQFIAVQLLFVTAMMFGVWTPIILFLSHHGVTSASLVVAIALLAGLSLYAALVLCLRPTALLVQRHLSDLTPTGKP